MFKLNLIEGIKNIDKNRTITYMSVILFSLLFLLQSYTYSYYVINNIQNESMEHETVKNYLIYGISSKYNYRMITQYIEPELAENLELEIAEFYEAIDCSQYVKYLTAEHNGININGFKGDPQIFTYREGAVHCLYVSPNFHKVEDYRVIKGRDFTD